ncbi:MAG: ATP-dependent zinc metalloprotease FtsH [Bacteroidales bacterium]
MATNNRKMPQFKFNIYWLYTVIALTLIGLYFFNDGSTAKEVNWTQFENYVEDGSIDKITVFRDKKVLEASVKDSSIKTIFGKEPDKVGADPKIMVNIPSVDAFADAEKEWRDKYNFNVPIKYDDSGDMMTSILWNIGPFLLIGLVWFFLMRRVSGGGGGGGNVFSVGKAKAQVFDKDTPGKLVTFKDVAGLSEAKEEIEEIVSFLKDPGKYTELGGKIPKGALLVGPPGTGKTLLAKAVAGEANVPFFSISGSDFVEMFVGVGASRVRDLFRQAKEKSPCIIFIDEIDAVGRARGKNPNMGGNDERENTLNQLLTEMDGFGSNSGVIILAATNRVDILDKALLRAGRFDRQITVDLPELNDRKEIFGVHLRPLKIDDSVDVDFLSRQTPGFSGADIANVCNEAALIAARRGKSFVTKQDFMDAVDRIIGGLERKSKISTVKEKEAIAIHEAGHATISWFLEYANPLVKVTIVPRGKALGAAWYIPEERQIESKEAMLDQMCATLGGRAAEEVFLGRISGGAGNDLERVTKQAISMVAYLGMSDKLPNISYYDSTSDYGYNKPYSDETARLIDIEVAEMIREQYERAKMLLIQHKEGHEKLTKKLIEKEVIYKDDLEEIFGPRAYISRTDEIIRLNQTFEANTPVTSDLKPTEDPGTKDISEKPIFENEEVADLPPIDVENNDDSEKKSVENK